MKLVFRTFFFHAISILVFTLLYFQNNDHFQRKQHDNPTMIDYFLLSTTIQAGVGITDIYPISTFGKITMIMQQLVMIMTNIITIYIFTL